MFDNKQERPPNLTKLKWLSPPATWVYQSVKLPPAGLKWFPTLWLAANKCFGGALSQAWAVNIWQGLIIILIWMRRKKKKSELIRHQWKEITLSCRCEHKNLSWAEIIHRLGEHIITEEVNIFRLIFCDHIKLSVRSGDVLSATSNSVSWNSGCPGFNYIFGFVYSFLLYSKRLFLSTATLSFNASCLCIFFPPPVIILVCFTSALFTSFPVYPALPPCQYFNYPLCIFIQGFPVSFGNKGRFFHTWQHISAQPLVHIDLQMWKLLLCLLFFFQLG